MSTCRVLGLLTCPPGYGVLTEKEKQKMNTENAKKLYMTLLAVVVLGLVIKPTSNVVLSIILLPIKTVLWFALLVISVINWFALLMLLIIGAAGYIAYCKGWIF